MTDCRFANGQRYSMAGYLTMAVAARLSRRRGVSAFAAYAQHLPLATKLKIGAFQSPTKGCFTRPSAASFRSLFSKLQLDTLDNARRQWVAATGIAADAIAIAGQDRKGARKPMNG